MKWQRSCVLFVALAASADDIYVLDAGTATLSTLDAGD